MRNVFPEYKSDVILGNGELQLDPMSYNVFYKRDKFVTARIWSSVSFSPKTKLGYPKEEYLLFGLGE